MGKGYDEQLEKVEITDLTRARSAVTVLRALEEYARFWETLDARLGQGNEVTQSYVKEFQNRETYELEEPSNSADKRRVELMKSSFLFPRIFPPEVARALSYDTIFRGKGDKYRIK